MSIRNKNLIIRLSEAEHQALKAKAGPQGMSAYLRGLAGLDEVPLPAPQPPESHDGPDTVRAAPVLSLSHRCTAKGCGWTMHGGSTFERCPKHGFEYIEKIY